MRKLNKWIRIMILFLGLIIVGCAPIIISNFKNIKLINKVHKDELINEDYDVKEKLGVIENIQTIVNVRSSKVGTAILRDVANDDNEEELLDKVKEQLQILEAQKVLPQLELGGDYILKSINKVTYLDGNSSFTPVILYQLTLQFTDFDIVVCVDNNTGIIYEFFTTLHGNRAADELCPENYFDYLGINKERMIFKADSFNQDYIYKDNSIKFTYAFGKYKDIISFSLEP